MNLQHLYYFKTIAELEHFTRAAEVLNVGQPRLSHAMQNLERELNVKLFTQSGRNVVLSPYGQMFLPHVTKALGILDYGVNELQRAVDSAKSVVTIACFPSLAQFLPDIIVRYVSDTDRTDVRLQTNQEATYYTLREQLLGGKVDLVFATEIDDPRIGSAEIGEHSYALLVPQGHRFAERRSVALCELDGEKFIAYSKDTQLRRQFDEYLRGEDIHLHISAESAQDMMIYGLVSAGHGIAVTPWPLGGAPYNVRVIPLEGVHKRKLYLMWNRESLISPAAVYFRDYVVKQGAVFDEYRLRNNIQ
ncbi:MAG: LysR family transcriptional regulator [Oscillospiraceae bacterium]|nr:LysR family transcriptional regulator [Oscillospiraceae bacterium]